MKNTRKVYRYEVIVSCTVTVESGKPLTMADAELFAEGVVGHRHAVSTRKAGWLQIQAKDTTSSLRYASGRPRVAKLDQLGFTRTAVEPKPRKKS